MDEEEEEEATLAEEEQEEEEKNGSAKAIEVRQNEEKKLLQDLSSNDEPLTADDLEDLEKIPQPIPYVKSVDSEGTIAVGLTKPTVVPADKYLIPTVKAYMETEFLDLNLQDGGGNFEMKGIPVFNEALFIQKMGWDLEKVKEWSEESEFRRLQEDDSILS